MPRKTAHAGKRPILSDEVVDYILGEVAAVCNVPREQLTASGRPADIALARQIAMWVMRQATAGSLVEVARAVARDQHKTVRHGVATVEGVRTDDDELRQKTDEILRRVTAKFPPPEQHPKPANVDKKPSANSDDR